MLEVFKKKRNRNPQIPKKSTKKKERRNLKKADTLEYCTAVVCMLLFQNFLIVLNKKREKETNSVLYFNHKFTVSLLSFYYTVLKNSLRVW